MSVSIRVIKNFAGLMEIDINGRLPRLGNSSYAAVDHLESLRAEPCHHATWTHVHRFFGRGSKRNDDVLWDQVGGSLYTSHCKCIEFCRNAMNVTTSPAQTHTRIMSRCGKLSEDEYTKAPLTLQ